MVSTVCNRLLWKCGSDLFPVTLLSACSEQTGMEREPPCQLEEENFWRSAESPVPGAGNRAAFLVPPMWPSRILAVMLLLRVAEDSYTPGEGGLVWGRMCHISLVGGVLTGPNQF